MQKIIEDLEILKKENRSMPRDWEIGVEAAIRLIQNQQPKKTYDDHNIS